MTGAQSSTPHGRIGLTLTGCALTSTHALYPTHAYTCTHIPDRQTYLHRQMDRHTYTRQTHYTYTHAQRHRQMDRHTYTNIHVHTDQTDRHTTHIFIHTDIDGQTHTYIHTDRKTYLHIYPCTQTQTDDGHIHIHRYTDIYTNRDQTDTYTQTGRHRDTHIEAQTDC